MFKSICAATVVALAFTGCDEPQERTVTEGYKIIKITGLKKTKHRKIWAIDKEGNQVRHQSKWCRNALRYKVNHYYKIKEFTIQYKANKSKPERTATEIEYLCNNSIQEVPGW